MSVVSNFTNTVYFSVDAYIPFLNQWWCLQMERVYRNQATLWSMNRYTHISINYFWHRFILLKILWAVGRSDMWNRPQPISLTDKNLSLICAVGFICGLFLQWFHVPLWLHWNPIFISWDPGILSRCSKEISHLEGMKYDMWVLLLSYGKECFCSSTPQKNCEQGNKLIYYSHKCTLPKRHRGTQPSNIH